ncbi:hypothetical protein Taro_010928 [Colocasia esculenta]|uniref:RNase H type-1 domain-containing protein n=1 Tax=Colocasia esculenta TaxID=4460 RepID=A0A843U960_COLES|nr:hypothetical protein [Colocasia esculenta]
MAPASSYPMLNMAYKMKHMKAFYRRWNKETFGNASLNLQTAKASFATAQQANDEDPSQANHTNFLLAKDKLDQKSPLKVYIPEDIWHDMPNKECTIQQAFSKPRSIHLQTALRTLFQWIAQQKPKVCPSALNVPAVLTLKEKVNRARFKGQDMSAKHVINRAMLSIHAISTTFKLHNISQPWLTALCQIKNGNQNLKINIPTIVKWLTPPKGRLKLNVDGDFKMTSGEAGGGGILRDHKGNMCCTFAKTYHGLNSSLAAEALALRDGLSICCSRGVSDDVAVKTQNLKAEIIHVPQEANKVADCLASYASSCAHLATWNSSADHPTIVKGPYHLDKVGRSFRADRWTRAESDEDRAPLTRVFTAKTPIWPSEVLLEAAQECLRTGPSTQALAPAPLQSNLRCSDGAGGKVQTQKV